MNKLLEGYFRFKEDIYPRQAEFFRHLAAKQQAPQALFITCSDSRIDPNLLTQTEPGDLFILRNAGNIVPPFGSSSDGTIATIEYAVEVLKVKHIIICGHSHCGAMTAMLNRESLADLPSISSWLAYAESTRQLMRTKHADADPAQKAILAAYENVLVQLDHLRTHPTVKTAQAISGLQLHGWVYFIESGDIEAFDSTREQFVALSETSPKALVH